MKISTEKTKVDALPRLLSGVFFHSVHKVVLKGDEVADEGRGTQTQTSSLWQKHLQVSVQTQIFLSVFSRQLYLS